MQPQGKQMPVPDFSRVLRPLGRVLFTLLVGLPAWDRGRPAKYPLPDRR